MHNYQNHTVDLSNCDTEPIHLIGRIQPHGFMIVMDATTFQIEQVSRNIQDFIAHAAPDALVGKPIAEICTSSEFPVLQAQLQASTVLNPQLLTLKGRQFFGFLHETEGRLVLECEPYQQTTDEKRFERTYAFSEFQTQLNNKDTLLDQGQLLVDYVQHILNYDRVMLYVFDTDWHGEVIAEKIKPGTHSYLHHHFPSTDIPAPARALLEKKHVRQIPDIGAAAVDLVPYLNPATGKPTDILKSELRNPSEIHLEYLRNMEAFATLSISVMVKGKLWGLITCQHQRPKFINYWMRQTCNLATKAFANAVLASQEMRDISVLEHYKQLEEALVNQVIAAGTITKGLFEGKHNLLDLTTCSGAALFADNELAVTGKVPDREQLMQLLQWLSDTNKERVFYTRELSRQFPAAAAYQHLASGLLALEISKYNKEYILYFKPEIRESVVWAGNPEKPELAKANDKIRPRKSFDKWVEIIKGKSLPWTLNELEITQVLLKDVIAIILRNQAGRLEQLNRNLHNSARSLRRKNERLEDFTHIITHNLRSPISNIQGLYNLYEAEPTHETGAEVMRRMHVVIDNMASTIDDLNAILRAALDQQLSQDTVNIAGLVEKEKQNMEAVLTETGGEILTDFQAPEITMPKVYMESLIHNLLSNAVKYRSPDRKPVVHLKSWQENNTFFLTVSDNGLGINLDRHGQKIFGLFQTFHSHKEAKGLGLYITKMQVESLGGTIAVESEPGQGTTFTVRFDSHPG
ncbi:ATP-binding protein [Pontibacter beigongshangensis]|uniref:ATP-binding protein n=1 Tax=Pontibacter beigongshangensis TaxID=2574733 RepID=UPI00164FF383|nr:ATP-binding protein [Pontibacter beigongshangensis]